MIVAPPPPFKKKKDTTEGGPKEGPYMWGVNSARVTVNA